MSKIKTPEEYFLEWNSQTRYDDKDQFTDICNFAKAYSDYRMEKWKEGKVKEFSDNVSAAETFRDSLHSEDADCYYYKGQVVAYKKSIEILKQ